MSTLPTIADSLWTAANWREEAEASATDRYVDGAGFDVFLFSDGSAIKAWNNLMVRCEIGECTRHESDEVTA